MEHSQTFIPLLIVIFLAFLVPLVLSRFKRIRVPIVVGEILIGILIGKSGAGWVPENDPILELLAEFGFVFLFFLAGTEIDFNTFLRKNGMGGHVRDALLGIVPISIYGYILTLGASAMAAWWMYSQGYIGSVWAMVLIFAPSSLGVIISVIKESNLSSTRLGQAILTGAIIADFGTLLLFTIAVAIFSTGLTLEILLIGTLFVAFFFAYRFGNLFFNRLRPVRKLMDELSGATAQIKVRAAFTALLMFVVLSEIIGTEIVLGAFLAGAVISLLVTPADHEAMRQLEAVGFGFFIPIFFIMIGVGFNLDALLNTPPVGASGIPQAFLFVPLLLVVAVLVKVLPSLLYRFHFGWRESAAIGVLLSARLSLMVAEAAIAEDLGLIDDSVNAAIILTAMILASFAPLVFNRFVKSPPVDEPFPVVVTGAGEIGIQVARQLRSVGEQFTLIDPDAERVSRAIKLGYDAIQASVDEIDPATTPLLTRTQVLINTYGDLELNYRICKLAREIFRVEKVVTRVGTPGDLPRFSAMGVTTLNPALDQAAMLVLLARTPSAYELLTRTDDSTTIQEVINVNSLLAGKSLRNINLPGDVLVLAVRRNGDLIVPHGNTRLELHDQLTLVGSFDDVLDASTLFHQQNR